MPKPRSSVDTRQKILDSAARLYRRDGIAATSMRQIAKAAGIKAGSVYNYFASKDQITSEIFHLGISRVADDVREALALDDGKAGFRAVLRAAIMAHLRAFFLYGDYTAMHMRNFKQAPARIRASTIKLRDTYEKLWSGLLKRGVAEGHLDAGTDLKLARLLLLGLMNWTLEWFQPKGRYTLEHLCAMIERMFLDGLGKPAKSPSRK
jgi:AcrR family transcriptional regulator